MAAAVRNGVFAHRWRARKGGSRPDHRVSGLKPHPSSSDRPPSPVNHPLCRRLSKSSGEKPFEPVVDRELQGPRPSDAALFVYGSCRDRPFGIGPNPRGNPCGYAAFAAPGPILRFAVVAWTALQNPASSPIGSAKLSVLDGERSGGFTSRLRISAPRSRRFVTTI